MALALSHAGFDNYDPMHRMSRRNSIAYGASSMSHPYDYYDSPGFYADPYMGEHAGQYAQRDYMYPSTSSLVPHHRRTPGAYDDLGIRDGYFESRPLSSPGGYYPRSRRHSVSFVTNPPTMDPYHRAGNMPIEFRRAGSYLPGITLSEAQSNVRLMSDAIFTIYDLHADRHDSILLKVKWVGYTALTYEIPIDAYDGHVSLQTLARRVSRACVHYLQSNHIPISWDCVELRSLQEVSYGVWQPMLAAR